MTCIVGLVANKHIYLGGDSLASTGSLSQTMVESKVFRVGENCIMGYSGTVRMCNLLRHKLELPEHPIDMSTEKYLTTLFVDALRTLLKDAGLAAKTNEQEATTGSILIAYRERLFKVGYDYCVMEASDGFDSIGSGDEIALGVMHATRHLDLQPQERIRLALEAAENLCESVRGPFTVEVLEPVSGSGGDCTWIR